jgi:thiol-disulfide isomerase/thioredoxin
MKKLILIISLLGLVYGTTAQNRSIAFEVTKEWKKVVNKAKKEKKLIFVDCYTDWCGPCKTLAANVFTRDDVADYFNRHFVNAKFEMEKDKDGILLKERFGIKAFPTLVFVDPKTEEVVHRLVGSGSAEWLIEGAKIAGDPLNNFGGLTKRYQAGERENLFLTNYLRALSSAYMQEELGKVATEYLNSISEEQFVTKENWDLIKMYVNDPLSEPLRYVMANREKFYVLAGKEVVDDKLGKSIKGAAIALASWKSKAGEAFDEARNGTLVKYLQTIDFAAAPASLAYLYTAEYARKSDFRGILNSMNEACKYNLFRGREGRSFFQLFIEVLGESKDSTLVQEGVSWIDRRCADTDDYFYKADLMGSKARLLKSIGDTLGVDQAKLDEERYNTEGEQKSNGHIIRAIRMN